MTPAEVEYIRERLYARAPQSLIAAETGRAQGTVSKIAARTARDQGANLDPDDQKARTVEQLDAIIAAASEGWLDSCRPVKKTRTRYLPTTTEGDGSTTPIVEVVEEVTEQSGDPRYLAEARKAAELKARILGLDPAEERLRKQEAKRAATPRLDPASELRLQVQQAMEQRAARQAEAEKPPPALPKTPLPTPPTVHTPEAAAHWYSELGDYTVTALNNAELKLPLEVWEKVILRINPAILEQVLPALSVDAWAAIYRRLPEEFRRELLEEAKADLATERDDDGR